VREILDQLKGRGTRGFQVTGSVTEVADELEALMDETDLDGFLLEPIFAPADLEDFAHWVVPELRRRGRLPEEPSTGTLREQMLGGGPHLRSDHFGARLTR
jgi:alkanesulfonate monooxygenase SsuD/methylene tetrahydromethanopterin reductase-like flavin-dependent oxidoreductase (luciferase family)